MLFMVGITVYLLIGTTYGGLLKRYSGDDDVALQLAIFWPMTLPVVLLWLLYSKIGGDI